MNGHIILSYPQPLSPVDFLDSFRTAGPCGLEVVGGANAGQRFWDLPPLTPEVTSLLAGSQVNVSWYVSSERRARPLLS